MKKKNNNNNSNELNLQLVTSQTNLSTLDVTNEKIETTSSTFVDIQVTDDNNNYVETIKKSL